MDQEARARTLFAAAEELGYPDAAEIARLAARLENGLPEEDELSVVFHWLGRCRLVHKLDQSPYPPGAWESFRVPDLLAVFEVSGRSLPVLVEVKKSQRTQLSWRPDYLEALWAYAGLVGMPLLVAWKQGGLWALFDSAHFKKAKKNYRISFAEAMRQSLMGILAGDFAFVFWGRVGLHIRARKLRKLSQGGFEGVIDDAYLLNARGERHNGSGGILALISCIEQEVQLEESETHVEQHFLIPEQEQVEFAHRVLPALVSMKDTASDRVLWRQLLRREKLSLFALNVAPVEAAKNALNAGFLRYVLNVRPVTLPAFLSEDMQSEKDSRSTIPSSGIEAS